MASENFPKNWLFKNDLKLKKKAFLVILHTWKWCHLIDLEFRHLWKKKLGFYLFWFSRNKIICVENRPKLGQMTVLFFNDTKPWSPYIMAMQDYNENNFISFGIFMIILVMQKIRIYPSMNISVWSLNII